jgi:hypothetical protein
MTGYKLMFIAILSAALALVARGLVIRRRSGGLATRLKEATVLKGFVGPGRQRAAAGAAGGNGLLRVLQEATGYCGWVANFRVRDFGLGLGERGTYIVKPKRSRFGFTIYILIIIIN